MSREEKTKDSSIWWDLWDTTDEVLALDEIDFIEDHYSKEIYTIAEIFEYLPQSLKKTV